MLLCIITRIKVVVVAETLAHVVELEFLPGFRLGEFSLAPVTTLGTVDNLVASDVVLHDSCLPVLVHETVPSLADHLTLQREKYILRRVHLSKIEVW